MYSRLHPIKNCDTTQSLKPNVAQADSECVQLAWTFATDAVTVVIKTSDSRHVRPETSNRGGGTPQLQGLQS